jgi:DNA-3-methyladenine glycosylase II
MEPHKKFLRKDPLLRPLLQTDIVIPKRSRNITMSLVWSILSQQLSIKVAKVMYQRFLDLFDNKIPSPEAILAISQIEIKAIGISERKANYIHNVAEFISTHKITPAKLNKMSDEEIIELLVQIKGVGRWTVEMLLIFGLGREDVFALDDLGVQKAMIELFNLQDLDKKELRSEMNKMSQRWSPYRSYVCLYMWKFSGFK